MRRPFFLFVFLSLVFRAIFAVKIGLIDDEAYHWSWTQNLQLSYYDHPGMIAWLEALSTKAFGDTLLGVRLPSFLCYLGTLFFTWKLSRDLFGDLSAKIAVLLFLWTPFWGFGGHVASPETPFMLCWILASCIVVINSIKM